MDGYTTVILAEERSWPANEDARFFGREVATLARFERPLVTWRGGDRTESGSIHMPLVELGAHGRRLEEFAYFNRPCNWVDDPRCAQQEALLGTLGQGQPAELGDWTTQQLWDFLLAVVRADRFNEGVFTRHVAALTVIADKMGDRLLSARSAQLAGGPPAWGIGAP